MYNIDEIKNTIINGDCLEELKKIPDESIDMVLQDPPYNTTACDWEWDIMTKIDEFWAEWKRVIKPNGAIVMTAGQPFTSALVMSNPDMFRYEWVWKKSRKTGFANSKKMPLKTHENIIKTYTNEGDLVFDGFIGSGTTAIACINTKRNYIGIDLKKEYCDIARKRISAIQPKLL